MGAASATAIRRGLIAAWLLLGVLVSLAVAQAAPRGVTVAVMPFRDLSGGSTYVGEAIRETVTSDLKEIGSLRIVERGSLDKVLAEQGVQAHKSDMDVATVVKLGKLVGASLIVIGAYQKLPPQLRLTARFVNVETSEVVGTAKVDGTTREFLRLQDRITAALLRSAGFAVHARRVEDDAKKRPDLASLKTLELYGQAVSAGRDDERRQYLRAAIAEDKSFSYAQKDLEDLEKRLQHYQAAAQPLQEGEIDSLRTQIRQTSDRAKAGPLMVQYLSKLQALHRWHALVREARTYLEELPAGVAVTPEMGAVAWVLIQHDNSLKDYDAVLRDGECWLKRSPVGTYSPYVQTAVAQAIERKRLLEENRRKVEAELSETGKDGRWDLCAVADLCRNAEQYEAGLRFYEACGQMGIKPWAEIYPLILLVTQYGGLWSALRKYLPQWEKADARAAQQWRTQYQGWFPEDE